MKFTRAALLLTMIGLSMGATMPATLPGSAPPVTPPPFDGSLSVLTYNIHGLPWPIARGRNAQFQQMATEIRAMRTAGTNPHVILLQEAFTSDAQSIGRAAGYRYIADGPGADMNDTPGLSAADTAFAAKAHWWKGEGIGKYVGSGLQILSDYPIVAIHRVAYPSFACAGYDCLANKGAMMVSIALPGRADPIDIVDTHMNSRGASRTPESRTLPAYRFQAASLTDFIRKAHDPARALIVAGDFNIGPDAARRSRILDDARSAWAKPGDRMNDAYGTAMEERLPLSADAQFSRHRDRDWQFFASGAATKISLTGIDTPFGHRADGTMLSDHVGYAATYRLTTPVIATKSARSKASVSGAEPA